MNLVRPKQPRAAGSGHDRPTMWRVLAILAALWLVGAPVQHALAHAAADSDHDATDSPHACLVCRVLSATPALDSASPTGAFMVVPACAFVEAALPAEPLVQADSHPTDFARGPPLVARFSADLTGRLRPT